MDFDNEHSGTRIQIGIEHRRRHLLEPRRIFQCGIGCGLSDRYRRDKQYHDGKKTYEIQTSGHAVLLIEVIDQYTKPGTFLLRTTLSVAVLVKRPPGQCDDVEL